MNNEGIKFYPLYWIYNDCWMMRTWGYDWWHGWVSSQTSRHMGHLHFFMPGFPIKDGSSNKQAYSGSQKYSFSLEDLWGPNSGDVNQPQNVRYVGSPKWHFEIYEYWRRVYIQPWNDEINEQNSSNRYGEDTIVGRTGIKWDASNPYHTYGPFREGKEFFLYWNRSARTLPIEYYLDNKKRSRDNYLNGSNPYQLQIPVDYEVSNSDSDYIYMTQQYNQPRSMFSIPCSGWVAPDGTAGYIDRPACVRINHNTSDGNISEEMANRWKNSLNDIGATYYKTYSQNGSFTNNFRYNDEKNYGSNSESNFGSWRVTCGDHRYIFPIIEYQVVKHLEMNKSPDYGRLPGWQLRDLSAQGGDGFAIEVELPYKINDIVQSPFSDDEGNVYPIGIYCHGFDTNFPERVMKYPKYDECDVGFYQFGIVTRTADEVDVNAFSEELVCLVTSTVFPNSDDFPYEFQEGEYLASGKKITKNGQDYYFSTSGFLIDVEGDAIFDRNPDTSFDEYRIPEGWKRKVSPVGDQDGIVRFNIPSGMKQDGIWVEQCFGGVVKAKAVVKIADNFGGEREETISTTKFFLSEQFEGSDQGDSSTNENS